VKESLFILGLGVVQVCAELRPLVGPLPVPRMADERTRNDNGRGQKKYSGRLMRYTLILAAILQREVRSEALFE